MADLTEIVYAEPTLISIFDMSYRHLLPLGYKDIVKQWVTDDCPTFDVGESAKPFFLIELSIPLFIYCIRGLRCW